MIVLSIKFKSALSYDEVLRVAEARLPDFQALPGLLQKYYGYERATDEFTGIYVWNTAEQVRAYRESELARSIPEAYQMLGAPRIELFDIPLTLRK